MGDSRACRVEALYIPFQEEGTEVREGIDIFLASDIPPGEFDAA